MVEAVDALRVLAASAPLAVVGAALLALSGEPGSVFLGSFAASGRTAWRRASTIAGAVVLASCLAGSLAGLLLGVLAGVAVAYTMAVAGAAVVALRAEAWLEREQFSQPAPLHGYEDPPPPGPVERLASMVSAAVAAAAYAVLAARLPEAALASAPLLASALIAALLLLARPLVLLRPGMEPGASYRVAMAASAAAAVVLALEAWLALG